MNWINDLLWGEGIGHSILLLSFVIAAGIQLGKIKVFGVSLGITLVLFVGIILGHFGFTINHNVIHFFKEFGLILFVYSVGMQVGPGFFSSFKQGGITLNMLACGIVFLGVLTAVILHYATGIPMPTMVGILSGAVTNTPGLGAAQQAFSVHQLIMTATSVKSGSVQIIITARHAPTQPSMQLTVRQYRSQAQLICVQLLFSLS